MLFDSTGDSGSERLQKSLKIWIKIFDFFSIRKFGIVDKGSDCDAKGPGFESRHRRSFKVSKDEIALFSRAYKSLNFNISTIFFFAKCHYPLIFLVNYTNF